MAPSSVTNSDRLRGSTEAGYDANNDGEGICRVGGVTLLEIAQSEW